MPQQQRQRLEHVSCCSTQLHPAASGHMPTGSITCCCDRVTHTLCDRAHRSVPRVAKLGIDVRDTDAERHNAVIRHIVNAIEPIAKER